jgi:hypothetical protein
MRPLTAALAVLVIVAAAAVALAAWAANAPDASTPRQTGEAATIGPTSAPTPTAEPEYDYPTVDSVGECYDPILQRTIGSLLAMRIIECDEPHLSELLGIGEIDAAEDVEWPGQVEVDIDAEDICRTIFRQYVGVSFERSRINMIYFSPNEETWASGDREVWCVADAVSAAPFTESVRGLRE